MSSTKPSDQNAAEVRFYLSVLRARRGTVGLLIALGILGALLLSYFQTPVYQAQSQVLVEELPKVPSAIYIPPPTLETEAELASSQQVAERVRDDLGLEESTSALLSGLSVDPVGADSQILLLTYTSTDPRLARDAATSFARDYLAFRRDRAFAQLRAARRASEQRIAGLERHVAELNQNISDARGNKSLIKTLRTERASQLRRLQVINERVNEVLPKEAVPGGEVIQPAVTPTSPTSPSYPRNVGAGLLVGLAFGIFAAFLREHLDDRLNDRGELEEALGVPVLTTIPIFSTDGGVGSSELVLLTQPNDPGSEAYRNLRTSLEFLLSRLERKTLIVTSPSPGDGKTVTTANLGIAIAQTGTSVLLISADLRRPTLESYFQVENKIGLSTILWDRALVPGAAVRRTLVPNLSLLPSGPIPPNPAELLSSLRLEDVLRHLEGGWEVVLIDSPPVLAVADAAVLASRTGQALIVIHQTTRRGAAVRAKEEIEAVGAELLGSILNALEPSASDGYYGSYYQYYSADQQPSTPPRRLAREKRRNRR